MRDYYNEKSIKRWLSLLLFILSIGVNAQQFRVKGKVMEPNGNLIYGANVFEKGSANGVSSGFDGTYEIIVSNPNAVLVVSFLGYEDKVVNISGKKDIDITLRNNKRDIEEIVIVGYTKAKRKDILGAVTSLKTDDIIQSTPVSAVQAVQGRVAGVQVLSDNSGPGSGFQVKVRGTSTFNAGTDPLYVVDGQQLSDISNINPNDIASLEVLKDGASAAIYGTKATNGVVIITTKSGKTGKTKITLDNSTIITQINSYLPVANGEQRIYYERQRDIAVGNTGLVEPVRDSLNTYFLNSLDLQKLLTRTAIRQLYNVSLSGGSDKNTYLWNTGYTKEEGVIINSAYKRFNTLFRYDGSYKSFLKFGVKLDGSYELSNGPDERAVFNQFSRRPAYVPIYQPDGSIYYASNLGVDNPVGEATLRVNDDRRYRGRMFNFIEFKLSPSFSFKSTLGFDSNYRKINNFEPTTISNVSVPINNVATIVNDARERQSFIYEVQQENILSYKKKFGDHNVSALIGTQTQRLNGESSDTRISLLFDQIQTLNNYNTAVPISALTSLKYGSSLLSYYGSVNYDYKGKYLLGGTFRRDGSSRFGPLNRFGNFPSASVGWRISSEDFMKWSSNAITNLMLRASYGVTGNQDIGDYLTKTQYTPGFAIYGNSSGLSTPNGQQGNGPSVNGVPISLLGNTELKWENTVSTNFGIDLSMFRNRFTLNLDFWKKTTDDLLNPQFKLPEETGFAFQTRNNGSVENKGIELSITGSIIKNTNFEWTSSFNITTLENKVTKLQNAYETIVLSTNLADSRNSALTYYIEQGQPIGNMYGYKNLGVFQYDQSNAFDNNGVQLTPVFSGTTVTYVYPDGNAFNGTPKKLRFNNRDLLGGDIYWQDANKDFVIDNSDRQVIGNGLAKYYGGFFNEFNYKNFSFSILFDYNFGNDIFKEFDQVRNDLGAANETPSPDRISGAWIKQGDIAQYPILSRANDRAPQNALINSIYVASGDFVKLRNFKFAYNMSPTAIQQFKFIESLSFNLSVNNLLTWTKYDGFNAELSSRGNPLQPGRDNLRYPDKTEVIFGFKLQL
jgi:TonB-dependent starch-binding outer membrane protein SusC